MTARAKPLRRRRAPVLIGRYSPHARKDDAWLEGVRAMAKAANKAGRKVRLIYKLGPVRKRHAWKYRAHRQRLRLEDAEFVDVLVS
jgi:hypothetical protein